MKAHEGTFHYPRYARARVTGETGDAFMCLHKPLFSMQEAAAERLAGHVMRWRQAQCVACPIGSSNPAILQREFSAWLGYHCTTDEFAAALGRLGFELDGDGIIAGLILREDFVAAIQNERQA